MADIWGGLQGAIPAEGGALPNDLLARLLQSGALSGLLGGGQGGPMPGRLADTVGASAVVGAPGILNNSGAFPQASAAAPMDIPPSTNDPEAREPSIFQGGVPIPRPRPSMAGLPAPSDDPMAAMASGAPPTDPMAGIPREGDAGAPAAPAGPVPFSMAPGARAPITSPAGTRDVEVPASISGQSSGFMGKVLNPANAPMLLALASGFSGAGSIGTGMRRAFGNATAPAAQLRQEQMMQMGQGETYKALVSRGVSPQDALAAVRDPDLKKAMLARVFETKAPEWKEIGVDRNGQKVFGFVDANKQTVNGDAPSTSLAGLKGPDNAGLTGEEFLATLDPPRQGLIKKLVAGDYPVPTGSALRNPNIVKMMEDAAQYDPTFNAANYPARAATRKDFTSGKSAQNLSAFNTAIAHLESLNKTIDKLGNSDYPAYNKVANLVSGNINPKYAAARKEFEASRTAVADELTRAFRGSGGNVHDIKQWEETINAADSPLALKAAVKQAADLLNGRILSVGETYNRGMGLTKDPLELLSPRSAAAFRRLQGETTAEPAPGTAPAVTAAPAPSDAPAGALPKISSPAEAAKLPKGTKFVDPNGVVRVVP
jgi:hypothetical protein